MIELSHFIGSVAGVVLLLLAWGLAHRLDAAFHAAVLLLATGIVVSLLKGIDYEEALVSGAALVLLLSARSHFGRRTRPLHELEIPTGPRRTRSSRLTDGLAVSWPDWTK